ncbi:MAG: hypothetical protein GY768_06720 [Planctomycetaceae bacterium]|nr:hypothetical protein [Planctomycetaceae bacterium]
MNRTLSTLVITTVFFLTVPATAGTIIKLGFSTDSMPDINLIDAVLSTADDGIGATSGDQNTEVTFLGALSGEAGIESDNASFTLNAINLIDNPTIFGTTILQATNGGNFDLYDQNNDLLLSGTLGNGTLSGPIGGTATGGFLTTEFGMFSDGSLLDTLTPEKLLQSSFSISLTDVNGGLGFSTGADGSLDDFNADATANIGARAVPEPAAVLSVIMGIMSVFALTRLL